MNHIQLANAIDKVRGYYNPAPSEEALNKTEDSFERAKAECLKSLEAQIEHIRAVTFTQFRSNGKILK